MVLMPQSPRVRADRGFSPRSVTRTGLRRDKPSVSLWSPPAAGRNSISVRTRSPSPVQVLVPGPCAVDPSHCARLDGNKEELGSGASDPRPVSFVPQDTSFRHVSVTRPGSHVTPSTPVRQLSPRQTSQGPAFQATPQIVTTTRVAQTTTPPYARSPRGGSTPQTALQVYLPVKQVVHPSSAVGSVGHTVSTASDSITAGLDQDLPPDFTRIKDVSSDEVMSECEGMLGWLDSQIWSMEKRREACDMRQGHLAELRRIIAETKGDTDRGRNLSSLQYHSSETPATDVQPREPGREKLLRTGEADLRARRVDPRFQPDDVHQSLRVECETYAARVQELNDLVESEEHRAHISEEASSKLILSSTLEMQSLREKLGECQQFAKTEEEAAMMAKESRSTVQSDLKALEDNSRVVLNDCRSLRIRVSELEAEKAIFIESHFKLEVERDDLSRRVRWLEEQLDLSRRSVADERESLNREHNAVLLQQGEEATQKLAVMQRQEALLREELSTTKAPARSRSAQDARADTLQQRCVLLESELQRAVAASVANTSDRLWMSELEEELINSRAAELGSEQRIVSDRLEMRNLHIELSSLETVAADIRNQWSLSARHVMSLEGEMNSARLEERSTGTGSQLRLLEEQLSELEAAQSSSQRRFVETQELMEARERSFIQALGDELEDARLGRAKAQKRYLDAESVLENFDHDAKLNESTQLRKYESELEESNLAQLTAHRQTLEMEELAEERFRSFRRRECSQLLVLEQELTEIRASRIAEQQRLMEMEAQFNKTKKEREPEATQGGQRSRSSEELLELHASAELRSKGLDSEVAELKAARAADQARLSEFGLRLSESERNQSDAVLAARRVMIEMQRQLLEEQSAYVRSQEELREAREAARKHEVASSAQHVRAPASEDHLEGFLQEVRDLMSEKERASNDAEQPAVGFRGVVRGDDESNALAFIRDAASRERKSVSFELKQPPLDGADLHISTAMSLRVEEPSDVEENRTKHVTDSEAGRVANRLGGHCTRPGIRPFLDSLTNLEDDFVQSALAVVQSVDDVLKAACATHVRSFEVPLAVGVTAGSAPSQIRERVCSRAEHEEIQLERLKVSAMVENCLGKLTSLVEEVDRQGQLTSCDREKVKAQMRIEVRKCEDDLRLLATSAFKTLDDDAIVTLVEVHRNGALQEWDKGFSPLHWAAQQGRRDVMEYILTRPGGADLLHLRDAYGRSPLAYAYASDRRATIVYWLREELGAIPPVYKPAVPRPKFDCAPEHYLLLMEQAEAEGVSWTEDHSLLHWAAETGDDELSRHLLHLDADTQAGSSEDRGRRMVSFAATESRSSTSSISTQSELRASVPEAYLKVMGQIDEVGWDRMRWAHNFTLLHWASKNDRPDLCQRFMSQRGDPSAKDDSGRTALDYAREHGAEASLEVMERGLAERTVLEEEDEEEEEIVASVSSEPKRLHMYGRSRMMSPTVVTYARPPIHEDDF